MDKRIIFLFMLLLIPIAYSLSEGEVDFSVEKGSISIKVSSSDANEVYSNLIEFNNSNGDTVTASFDCSGGNCQGINAKRISFDAINIFIPGNYYFVITSLSGEGNKVKKEFKADLSNLNSCEEYEDDKGFVYIKNNACYFEFTGNETDKGSKCVLGGRADRCTECGCQSGGYLCCTNENIEECIGKLGQCVLPGESRISEKEVKEKEVVVGKEVVGGCLVQGVNVPQGICLNNVLALGLQSSDDLFAQQCSCVDRGTEADLDNDGFDSIDFVGGRDCNDGNPRIHPLILESCENSEGFDGVDNNCDGAVDLDCGSFCDKDGDGYTSNLLCTIIGKNSGECDDYRADRYPNFPGVEICGDLIDNNCDNVVDNNDICVCTAGDTRAVGDIRRDGVEECVDGKRWETVKEPNESPLVFVNTAEGSVESGDIDVKAGEEFEIEVKFLCSGRDCDVEIA